MSYSTKVTVEVDVDTQFGPKDALELIVSALNHACFTSVKIVAATSDYEAASPLDINTKALKAIPFQARYVR